MKTPRQLILEEVAEIARLNGVAMYDLMGSCKVRAAVRARRAAMWFVWFKYGWSFAKVAKLFGRKEHSATFHAIGTHLLECGFIDHPMAIAAKRRRDKIHEYQRGRPKRPWQLTKGARIARNYRRRMAHVPKAERAAA